VARRIVFSPRAGGDLDRLRDFIATESRASAERAIARIVRGVKNLEAFPELGVAIDGGFRQLVLKYGKSGYVIRYRVLDDAILITRVWHGREDRRR
jgi:plasmid stabilization system protein ParE